MLRSVSVPPCVFCVLSVVRPVPALQREHQADGSQEQHPTPETGAQHVSAALDGGEQQGMFAWRTEPSDLYPPVSLLSSSCGSFLKGKKVKIL